MMRRWLAAALGLLIAAAGVAGAETERIISYHSDVTVHEDASLTVVETIEVYAAGEQIVHGIYRDFPTLYKASLGDAGTDTKGEGREVG